MRPRVRPALRAAAVAVVLALGAAACSGSDERAAPGPSTAASGSPTPTTSFPGTGGPSAPSGGGAATGAVPPPDPASYAPTWHPRWVLSLGDSLGFGFQEQRFVQAQLFRTYRADQFPGWTGILAGRLAVTGSRPPVTNLACPGETTTSMVGGGCPFPPALLHDPYTGAQLSAATGFLARHAGQQGVITLSIGANDAIHLLRCRPQPGCTTERLPAVSDQLRRNLTAILDRLRQAAPDVPMLVLKPYNPYALSSPGSDAVVAELGRQLDRLARAHRAVVVDAFADFNAALDERARLCAMTGVCDSAKDIHPSTPGYERLADLFWAVLPSAVAEARRSG